MTIDHTYQEFAEGIKKPIREIKTPIRFMDDTQLHVGEIYTNLVGEQAMIIEYNGKGEYYIQFQDQYGYIYSVGISAIKHGWFKNPYRRDVNGGYFGVGDFKAERKSKTYRIWIDMMRRVLLGDLSKQGEYTKTSKGALSYENVSVSEEWKCYQNFARWFLGYMYPLNKEVFYELDKDALQWGCINKVYGPYTACMLPHEINQSLIGYNRFQRELPRGVRQSSAHRYLASIRKYGIQESECLGYFDDPMVAFEVYKRAKEDYIKELANKYWNIGALYPEVYNALMNIQIEPF